MKLTGKTIIILGIAKFDGPFESTSYTTAKYLADDNDVYYIDNPFTWKDFFSSRKTGPFKTRRPYFFSPDGLMSTEIGRLKIVITFPLLPINFLPEGSFYRLLLSINEGIIRRRIRRILKRGETGDHFVFLNSFNFHYPNVANGLGRHLSVYHCVDPLIVDFDRRHGIISEQILIRKSDLVVCTSRQLFEEKKNENSNTYFIPNAADLKHSSKALDKNLPVSERLANIPGPILGYFGNIERRIDFQLLNEIASRNPDKSIVLAGPVDEAYLPEGFSDMANIYFTGRTPYQDMPAVIKGFDVAMIPFKKDDVSRTIFPLKLFEYLGAGLPVVATDFNPDLEEFTAETVSYCRDVEEFNHAIIEAINTGEDAVKKSRRLAVASENTWEKRLSEFSMLISTFYNRHNG